MLRVYNKLRIFGYRFTGKRIATLGKPLLSTKTELSIAEKAFLVLGNGVITERGVLLGARTGATLAIGNNVYINRNCCIVARDSISIGKKTKIAPNVCIYDHDHNSKSNDGFVSSPIIIGDNVWIGSNCVILKGVTIGNNTIISAGSVITKDIPDNVVVYQKKENTIKPNAL